jgi:hypothetical protein
VVDMPEDPHPNSCWHHDTPGLSMAQNPHKYGSPRPQKKSCGGLLGKIGCALTSSCGTALAGVGELGLSFGGPYAQTAALGITGGYAAYDIVNRKGVDIGVDIQSSYGNMAGIIHSIPGGHPTNLGKLSIETSIFSTGYYGAKCAHQLGLF